MIRQEKRSALMAERREKTVQITEIRQGLKRLNLAICLGVPARDLVAESVDVPRESIGRVRGTLPEQGAWSKMIMIVYIRMDAVGDI